MYWFVCPSLAGSQGALLGRECRMQQLSMGGGRRCRSLQCWGNDRGAAWPLGEQDVKEDAGICVAPAVCGGQDAKGRCTNPTQLSPFLRRPHCCISINLPLQCPLPASCVPMSPLSKCQRALGTGLLSWQNMCFRLALALFAHPGPLLSARG